MLAGLPVLLRIFMDALRQRQKAFYGAETLNDGIQHTARQLEFAFFMEVHRIAEQAGTIDYSASLAAEKSLLELVGELGIYRASNDEICLQQRAFLVEICAKCVDRLKGSGESMGWNVCSIYQLTILTSILVPISTTKCRQDIDRHVGGRSDH